MTEDHYVTAYTMYLPFFSHLLSAIHRTHLFHLHGISFLITKNQLRLFRTLLVYIKPENGCNTKTWLNNLNPVL